MERKENINILSVNISEKKGTVKRPVERILVNNKGVINDAHAGDWHRQVSLLGKESFERFSKTSGRTVVFGEFAENITTEGIELFHSTPGDRFLIGNVELEVTQIGKKCHGTGCAIFAEVGNCVMPKEGIFCKVIQSGEINKGDTMIYVPMEKR
ncbi:MAG: MOSC domain-containing protein [Bacteroidota bacterium]|nr:MOSC domain-containing protein [Bacteroidota bacterium]